MSTRPPELPPRHHKDEACPTCDSPVGATCVSNFGRPTTPHVARLARLRYVARNGMSGDAPEPAAWEPREGEAGYASSEGA